MLCKSERQMKRYSVSVLDGKDRYQCNGRTDNLTKEIEKFKKRLAVWKRCVEEQDTRTNDYCGIKITDSKTNEVVFEEAHYAEELGYRKEYELVGVNYGFLVLKEVWVKL